MLEILVQTGANEHHVPLVAGAVEIPHDGHLGKDST